MLVYEKVKPEILDYNSYNDMTPLNLFMRDVIKSISYQWRNCWTWTFASFTLFLTLVINCKKDLTLTQSEKVADELITLLNSNSTDFPVKQEQISSQTTSHNELMYPQGGLCFKRLLGLKFTPLTTYTPSVKMQEK